MSKTPITDRTAILLILVIACALILPMAFLGIPDGFDLLQHIRFASAYLDAFQHSRLVPQWAANDNFGLGSVGIRFYPPLAYLLLALTGLFTGNWYDAFWINSLFWMFLGCVGVYLLAKEWVNNSWALIAALLYGTASYHTFQIYQAVLFAEFAAAGILPFCFLFLTRVCSRRDLSSSVRFAISVSLLLLTHIPSAIIGSVCLGIFAVLVTEWRKLFSTLPRLGLAYVAALAATAFHWIKLVTEINWVKHNSAQFFSNGYYDFHRYFYPLYLITPANRYKERLLWEFDLIISITILLFLPSIAYIVIRSKHFVGDYRRQRPHLAMLSVGLFSLLMLSQASSFLWEHILTLQKIQFPWRWLLVATLAGPVCFVTALSYLSGVWIRRAIYYGTVAFILAVTLYSLTQNILQSNPLERNVFDKQVSQINSSEGCTCWWPVWANENSLRNGPQIESGARKSIVESWSSDFRVFTIDAGDTENVHIATFWYPYWKATANGVPVDVGVDDDGTILLSIPPEKSELKLYFEEPTVVVIAKYISVIFWIGLIGTLFTTATRRKK